MTRDEALERLPFYVNGTLAPDEAGEIAALIESDARLRAEADALAALRQRMQAEPVQSPGEAGLERLMTALDRAEPANLPTPPGIWRGARIWQVAAAALLAVAVVQGLLLSGLRGEDGFDLAGAEGRMAEAAFRVTFDPGATEAQIRSALLDAGVVIVNGPSALGFYDLAPLEGVDAEEAARLLENAAAIEALQPADDGGQ